MTTMSPGLSTECFAMPRWNRHLFLEEAMRPVDGVFFAGDYASESAGTHGCLNSADRVSNEVREFLSR